MEDFPDQNSNPRDPREDMTPEELREREDNLRPLSEIMPEVEAEIRARQEADPLEKARRQLIALENARVRGETYDHEELEALRSEVTELESAERAKKENPEE